MRTPAIYTFENEYQAACFFYFWAGLMKECGARSGCTVLFDRESALKIAVAFKHGYDLGRKAMTFSRFLTSRFQGRADSVGNLARWIQTHNSQIPRRLVRDMASRGEWENWLKVRGYDDLDGFNKAWDEYLQVDNA